MNLTNEMLAVCVERRSKRLQCLARGALYLTIKPQGRLDVEILGRFEIRIGQV